MPSIEKLKILYEGIRKAARGYEKAFVALKKPLVRLSTT